MIDSIRIRVTIVSSYIIIGLLTLLIGVSSLITYSEIRSTSERTADVLVQSFNDTLAILYHVEDVGVYLLSEGSPNAVNIMPGPSEAELIELVGNHFSLCEQHLGLTGSGPSLFVQNGENNTTLSPTEKFRDARYEWRQLSADYKQYLDSNSTMESEPKIRMINTQLLPRLKTTIVKLHDFQLAIIQAMADDQSEIHESISKSSALIKPLLITGVILATFLCWLSVRLVIKPINKLVDTMERIQKGVTTTRFSYSGKDEMGYLALTFNDMVTRLHNSITEATKTKEALEKNQRLFQELFEFAPDSIIMINGNGVIQRANQHTEILFGCKREWLIGKRFDTLLADSIPTDSETDLAHVFMDYIGSSRTQIRMQRKDGVEFLAEINFKAMETENGPYIAASIREFELREKS